MAATIQTIQKPTKARALDTSGNNNHGQIYSGRALEFDGVTDYLDIGSLKTLVDYSAETTQANRAWTVACWINIDAIGSLRNIIGEGSGISSTYICVHSDGQLAIWDVVGAAWRQGNTILGTNTWYRAAFVFDGDETVSFYLNGVADGSGIINTASDNADLAFRYIGKRSDSSSRLWNGKLADLQLWQGAFTAEDVLYDYNNPEQLALNRGGTSLTNSNLKAWYPMNDGHRGQQSYILDASNTGLSDNLVINGGFDADTGSALTTGDDWVLGTGWSIANGKASCDGSQTGNSSIYQEQNAEFVSPDLQATWKIVFTISDYSAGTLMAAMGGYDYPGDPNVTFAANGTHEVYHKPTHTSSNNRVYFTANTDFVGSIDNVEVYRVNDKNHATTVFYGDELVTNGDMEADDNWTNISSPSTNEQSGTQEHGGTYSRKFTPSSSNDGIQGDVFTTVAGRTYYLDCWVYPDDATTVTVKYTEGNGSTVQNFPVTGLTENAWNNITQVIVDTTGGAGAKIAFHSGAQTSGDWYIDDVSIKEQGIASGWTDADQQLDIPQTALQSYNQFLYGFDYSNSGFAAPTCVKINNNSAFDFGTNNFSASVWFRRDGDMASYHNIFRRGGWSGRGYSIALNSSEQLSINFSFGSGSDNMWAHTAATIEKGKWYHAVGTWDRSGNQQLYLNGEKQTMAGTGIDISGESSETMNSSNDLYLYTTTSDSETAHFPGVITELALFDNVLFGQDQVNELYNDGKALDVMTSSQSGNCHGYWRNNGLSQWKDLSGEGNHSSEVDGSETMLITAGVDGSRDSQGFIMNRQRTTNSLNLRTSETIGSISACQDSVKVEDLESFDHDNGSNSKFSISLWFKPSKLGSLPQKQTLLSKYDTNGDQREWWLYLDTSGTTPIKFIVSASGTSGDHANSLGTITTTDWHHIVVTYDGSNFSGSNEVTSYLDGGSDNATNATNVARVFAGTAPVRIGDITNSAALGISNDANDSYGLEFDGEIDDVCYYNRKILSATEAKRMYNAGKRSHR